MRPRHRVILAAAVALGLLPIAAHSATAEAFQVRTARDLVNLCKVPPGDPMHEAARSLCYGFLAGAYQYDHSLRSGPDAKPLVCLTDPKPTRAEAAQRFVRWAEAQPCFGSRSPLGRAQSHHGDRIILLMPEKRPAGRALS